MDPVGALIGTVFVGMGLLIVFGAIKNKKVFGAGGILPTALTTGTIADLTKIPAAFGSVDLGVPLEGAADGVLSTMSPQRVAVANIAKDDPSLGTQLLTQMNLAKSARGLGKPGTVRSDLMPLAQLLAIADAKNHKTDADIIRVYIKGLTGESI